MNDIKIYDVAPTILHILDLPIPIEIDGRVLKEIFREDSKFTGRKIRRHRENLRHETKEKIKFLKRLGKYRLPLCQKLLVNHIYREKFPILTVKTLSGCLLLFKASIRTPSNDKTRFVFDYVFKNILSTRSIPPLSSCFIT